MSSTSSHSSPEPQKNLTFTGFSEKAKFEMMRAEFEAKLLSRTQQPWSNDTGNNKKPSILLNSSDQPSVDNYLNDSKKFRKSVSFQVYDSKNMGGVREIRKEMGLKLGSLKQRSESAEREAIARIAEMAMLRKVKKEKRKGRFGSIDADSEEAESTTRYMLNRLFDVVKELSFVLQARFKVNAFERLQSNAGQVGLKIFKIQELADRNRKMFYFNNYQHFMTWSRQNRRNKAINQQKLNKLLSVKSRKQKMDLYHQLVKYAQDLKNWIGDVNYALGIYRRENVFWRLKCFKKYCQVKKLLAWNRKVKFVSETKRLVQMMIAKEDSVIQNNEQGTRTKFWKLWLESIVVQKKKQQCICNILKKTHTKNLSGPFNSWKTKFLYQKRIDSDRLLWMSERAKSQNVGQFFKVQISVGAQMDDISNQGVEVQRKGGVMVKIK